MKEKAIHVEYDTKKRPEKHMTHTTVALEDKFARILRYGLTVMLITIFSDLLFQNLTI